MRDTCRERPNDRAPQVLLGAAPRCHCASCQRRWWCGGASYNDEWNFIVVSLLTPAPYVPAPHAPEARRERDEHVGTAVGQHWCAREEILIVCQILADLRPPRQIVKFCTYVTKFQIPSHPPISSQILPPLREPP